MQRPDLPHLTSLRFLAAMAVVVSHFTHMALLSVPEGIITALDGGRPAVSFFFVLSGFILAYNYVGRLEDPESRRRYYIARFARIYPVHLLGLAIALLAFAVAFWTDRITDFLAWSAVKEGEATSALSAGLLAQILVLTAWLPFAGINQPWNGPSWSISCEFFFYAVLPGLLPRMRQLSTSRLLAVVVVGWMAQGAWIVVVRHFMPLNRAGFLVSQFPIAHVYEFILGVGCAMLLARHRSAIFAVGRWPLAAICSLIVLLSVWQPLDPAYYVLSPLFAGLILLLAARPAPRLLAAPRFILLGEASFALYLLHVPVGTVARLMAFPASYGPILLAGVVALSVVAFRWYEQPLRRIIRSESRAAASGLTSGANV